jgi:long-chain acyl-CoA synthetase
MTLALLDSAGPTRLHHLLGAWVQQQPEAPALRDAHLALSHHQLDEASRRAAEQLTSLGVRAGDRVLMVAENCAALGVLLMALSRLDAWSIVSNARLSEREIDVVMAHAEPVRVIYTARVSADAARHATRHGAVPMQWHGAGELMVGPRNDAAVP